MKLLPPPATLLAVLFGFTAQAYAVPFLLTVQNHSAVTPTGLYNGPVWLGFHTGGFDLFDPGTVAGPGIEALAELGDGSVINTAFNAAMPTGLSLTLNYPPGAGPGIFAPGGSNSVIVDLDPSLHRFLSFGAMIVPSNDTFVANADPMGLELFGASGNFLGTQTWTVTGANAWDAGTELNMLLNGAAFVSGVDATLGTSEGGMIQLQTLNGLDGAIGLTTPAGTTIGEALTADPLISIRIQSVPDVDSYGWLAMVGVLAFAEWKRRRHLGPTGAVAERAGSIR